MCVCVFFFFFFFFFNFYFFTKKKIKELFLKLFIEKKYILIIFYIFYKRGIKNFFKIVINKYFKMNVNWISYI